MNLQLCSPYSLRTTVVRVLNTPQSLIEISIDCSVPGLVVLQHENASEQFVARGGRIILKEHPQRSESENVQKYAKAF